MKYKIEIEELTNIEGKEYPRTNKVYEQIIEDLPLEEVILLVNSKKKV